MDNIEEALNMLQPQEQDNEKESDLDLFRKSKASKKKKKNKLFSEIDNILETSNGDDDMMMLLNFKPKKKDEDDADGDIFNTSGKSSKKIKSLEAKFKPELANLQRLLKDNELTAKTIKSIIDPIISSKARGSSKMLVDLLLSLNSANNNRLSTIREISSVKKAIYDLKIKMEKDAKDPSNIPADQFGSKFFDDLFKHGRDQVIDTANSYQQDLSAFNNTSKTFSEICDERLAEPVDPKDTAFRTPDGTTMIKYELKQPEICIKKSFNTGDISIVAIGNDGLEIEGYPVPTRENLGKLLFNDESGTCTDETGRVYKVIDVV